MPEHRSTLKQKASYSFVSSLTIRRGRSVLGAHNSRAMRVGVVSIVIASLTTVVGIHSRTLGGRANAANSVVSVGPTSLPVSNAAAQGQLAGDTSTAVAAAPPLPTLQSEISQSQWQAIDSENSQVDESASSIDPSDNADIVTRTMPIAFHKVIHLSRSEAPGETRVVTAGQDGLLQKTYHVIAGLKHGPRYDFVSQRVVKLPVDMEVLAGYDDRSSLALPSRSGVYNRTAELDMIATGYSPSEGPGHGYCKTGMRAGYGVVAVDPRLIPLRSRLYISGYGYAIAGDTGGAIKGHRIDLGQNTRHQACMVGRRRVHVYLLATP